MDKKISPCRISIACCASLRWEFEAGQVRLQATSWLTYDVGREQGHWIGTACVRRRAATTAFRRLAVVPVDQS